MKKINIDREEALNMSRKFGVDANAVYFIGQDGADAIWGAGNTKSDAIADAIKNIRECCSSQDLEIEDEEGNMVPQTDEQLLLNCSVMEVADA